MKILDDSIQNEERLLEILELAKEVAGESKELFLMAARNNEKLRKRLTLQTEESR
jgi:hypothetical protein